MDKGKIVILSGPSGSGKTTIYKKLLASKRFKAKLAKSISVTTRPSREGEKHGRDYLFVSKKQFLYKKRAGHFLESQKVFDNYYGTAKKHVREILRSGKHVLLCIDVKGAKVVSRQYPEALKIFITVPSLDVLKQRLQKRGSENKAALTLRLAIAKKELQEAKTYDLVVVNDSLTKAYKKIESMLLSHLQGKSRK